MRRPGAGGPEMISRRAKTMWPPKETSLNDQEKAAYRYLLYQAMVDIRNLCQSRGSESWNPLKWWWQYRRSRVAGALADWLHNLAAFASRDFEGFSADWFWREYANLGKRLPALRPSGNDYRLRYEEQLARLGESRTGKSEP
jgi:hypothetical protein